MAKFEYKVGLNEEVSDSHLWSRLIEAIEIGLVNKKVVVPCSAYGEQIARAYRTLGESDRVVLGVKISLEESNGIYPLCVELSGKQRDILNLKGCLESSVEGLKLS